MAIGANFLRRYLLGSTVVMQVLMAMEDKKVSADEVAGILTTLFQGLGAEGVDFGGLSVVPSADGGMDIHIPANVIKKLS